MLKAEQVISDLKARRVAPRVIIILGEGADFYGRRLYFFADEDAITEEGVIELAQLEFFYAGDDFSLPIPSRLIMLAPDQEGEPLVEPVIYSPEQLMSFRKELVGEG